MKLSEHLQNCRKPFFTIEVLPPLKGQNINDLYRTIDPVMEFNVPFVNVTYHCSEYIYKKRDNGYLEKVMTRKRPGTVGICAAIMNRYKVDAVAHIICGGFNRQETEDALVDLHYLGINNVLALRGDPPKSDSAFKPEAEGHSNAMELTRQIANMNRGVYLEEDLTNSLKTDFCIGVAGYPEKHMEAPNLLHDIAHLKSKVAEGASYIVTQMFFDNQKYFEFVRLCREAGITVPIIPGLKPIHKKRQALTLPKTFHIDIPEPLFKALDGCENDKAAYQVGKEWAIQQSRELLAKGAPCVHYFSFDSVAVADVVREVF